MVIWTMTLEDNFPYAECQADDIYIGVFTNPTEAKLVAEGDPRAKEDRLTIVLRSFALDCPAAGHTCWARSWERDPNDNRWVLENEYILRDGE